MSDYNEHLISMAGGDGDELDRIQAREIDDMEDLIDGGIMRTLSGRRIARILSSRGFGRTGALLATVREQRAALDAVKTIETIKHGLDHDARFANGYNAAIAGIRAAITTPEAS